MRSIEPIGKDTSIVCAKRRKKRGRKRKKAQSALVVYVSCSTGVGECFLTLWQTHFFTRNWYSQDEYYILDDAPNEVPSMSLLTTEGKEERGAQSMVTEKSAQGKSFLEAVGKSFYDSIGDIVFGMEDGTVSIFGLVFGVASSTSSSSVVLLAGATGAISAAVSMMAGTFLDVESTNDQAKARLAQEQIEIDRNLEGEKQEVRDRLKTAGFNDQDTTAIVDALARHPKTLLQVEAASEFQSGSSQQKNPFVQSIWMFISDLFAASVPVIPFAFLSLDNARLVSLIITALLLLLLGVGRGLVGRRNVLVTALETLGIATAAAVAGFLVGKLVTH